jgi:glucosamine-6-phosphate deaminase
MTLGLREILFARRVLLLASGAHKAGVLARMIRGEVTTRFPASFLRLHPRVSIFCDQEAASQL